MIEIADSSEEDEQFDLEEGRTRGSDDDETKAANREVTPESPTEAGEESNARSDRQTNGMFPDSLEVVIRPLSASRRAQYLRPPPSDFVSRILSKISLTADGERYQIEYDDGRLDQV